MDVVVCCDVVLGYMWSDRVVLSCYCVSLVRPTCISCSVRRVCSGWLWLNCGAGSCWVWVCVSGVDVCVNIECAVFVVGCEIVCNGELWWGIGLCRYV